MGRLDDSVGPLDELWGHSDGSGVLWAAQGHYWTAHKAPWMALGTPCTALAANWTAQWAPRQAQGTPGWLKGLTESPISSSNAQFEALHVYLRLAEDHSTEF